MAGAHMHPARLELELPEKDKVGVTWAPSHMYGTGWVCSIRGQSDKMEPIAAESFVLPRNFVR